ncbi:MAG: PstS family phosphate ABC transporter substrate-binding protein [Bdellovibrionales bacterium]|nr:PstS family phosphate ABC transporter substrate-binding protein [Bdellovibrionales bacterium]
MNHYVSTIISFSLLLSIASFSACEKKQNTGQVQGQQTEKISGLVKIDGSSTVFPLTEAVAEEFQKEHREIRVTVGFSGTGGGMKKLIANEIDLSGASRPIKDSEATQAKDAGVDYQELQVAYDGIAVIVNPKNNFVTSLSTDQLQEIWKPNSRIKTWADLDASWPNEEIKLYGPGPDSGTFDYFTETIVGESKAIRSDFTASEDDNVLVHGVSGDQYALGYFGFAYYRENASRLKLIPIRYGNEGKPTFPSHETIADGSYKPLSRPIFMYLNKNSWKKPEVQKFVNYYLDHAGTLAEEVGYVSLEQQLYKSQQAQLLSSY